VAVEAALARIEGVEGWLSEAQARRLHGAAEGLPASARIVEIGSYRGRSAIVFADAAGDGVEVVAIDPHAGNDRGPQQIQGTAAEGDSDHQAFRANLERAGAAERVRHVRLASQAALDAVDGPVDVLYVDGAHRYRPASADIVRWGDRVAPGGTMLIHDSFSSIGVTLAILRHLVPSGRFAYVGRTGSLAEYRRTEPRGRARLGSALAQIAQLPWFARNVLVKVALVLRLRPVARALGHASGDWPY
jgi:predicted O-methyltransferase YrrM